MLKWLVVLACAAGCKERTELMIGVATDLRAPDALDSARLVVSRDGVPVHDVRWEITGSAIPENLPGSYGIFSDGEELPVDIQLLGFKGTDQILDRRALITFIEGRTLFFRMTLVAGCVDRTDCSDNQSCIEGSCQDRAIDSRTLPEFEDSFVTELTCASGPAYLDTATNLPMSTSADAMACPSNLCSEGTCHVDPSTDGDPVPPRADAGTGEPDRDAAVPPGFECADDSAFEPNDATATAFSIAALELSAESGLPVLGEVGVYAGVRAGLWYASSPRFAFTLAAMFGAYDAGAVDQLPGWTATFGVALLLDR